VRIEYDPVKLRTDLLIKETVSGNTFWDMKNREFLIRDFNNFRMGFWDEPNYGNDWSPIRIDNVNIVTYYQH
jgi:hypothetical protein